MRTKSTEDKDDHTADSIVFGALGGLTLWVCVYVAYAWWIA